MFLVISFIEVFLVASCVILHLNCVLRQFWNCPHWFFLKSYKHYVFEYRIYRTSIYHILLTNWCHYTLYITCNLRCSLLFHRLTIHIPTNATHSHFTTSSYLTITNYDDIQNGFTAIMLAAYNGHLNVVTYLKENGADMDHESKVSMVCRMALWCC